MSGYLTIISLVCFQILRVMAVNDSGDKKLLNNVWMTNLMDDKLPGSRAERSDQFEMASDVLLKDASEYPRITRRGYAGEEFFLKASKSVPRIGRRNNDVKESPKRSFNKDEVNVVEYWPYAQSDDTNGMARKYDFDVSYGCQQLDAKTVLTVDTYNFVCNDQFYCCASPKRSVASSPNANYL